MLWRGWWMWWAGLPGRARFRTVIVMMIMTCGMGMTLSIGSRMGSVSVVERWVSPGGSVFRVGLRWSLGTARSTTASVGLMVLVWMSLCMMGELMGELFAVRVWCLVCSAVALVCCASVLSVGPDRLRF